MSVSADQAEKRRNALKRFMAEHSINATELARKAGWKSPNVIYNFLKGRSRSLSTQKYEEIAAAMPSVTISDLTDEKPKKIIPPVLVKSEARAGTLREQFSLPASRIRELPLPVTDAARLAGAFAVTVRHPGAEQIYPEGSLLLCVPIEKFDGELTKGRRVIVERFVDTRLEVTVREVQADGDGLLWLSQRSHDPRFADAVKLPKTISGKPWRDRAEKFSLAGIVVGAFVPEG